MFIKFEYFGVHFIDRVKAGCTVLLFSTILTGNTSEAFGNRPSLIASTSTITMCTLNTSKELYDSPQGRVLGVQPLPRGAIVRLFSYRHLDLAQSIQFGRTRGTYWFPIIAYERYHISGTLYEWTKVRGYEIMYIQISRYEWDSCVAISPATSENDVQDWESPSSRRNRRRR